MKILIVSNAFFPEISPRSIRTTELAKAFSILNHEVHVLTLESKESSEMAKKYGFKILKLTRIFFKPIPIPSGGIFRLPARILSRVLQLLFDYPDIFWSLSVKKALKKIDGYDLMISIAVPYPIHWGVAFSRTNNHRISKIWVADCGDPYYGLESDSFRKLFYFKYIEKYFSKKADYISIPIEKARNSYFNEFHNKIVVIPQGFSFPKVREEENVSLSAKKICFAYTGNISSYIHYAAPFIEMLSTLNVDFEFILFTDNLNILGALNRLIPKNYKINKPVDRELLFNSLKNVNFFVHFPYKKDGQQSLKLVDYHFMNKPILSFDNSENAIKTFIEFMEGNYAGAYKLDNPNQYKIENVVDAFINLAKTGE